ncbi:hypothetical protein NDU88_007151 [Pleurodeles waltl]|uniref:Uncharacterized protein n=1 Tax=Pleurodeles waltl TaxID=8319 RepID=A0AAV7MPE7_PLEWA|nr:hypothetical protein NDU88_007151 [Pleurodeles waltl]
MQHPRPRRGSERDPWSACTGKSGTTERSDRQLKRSNLLPKSLEEVAFDNRRRGPPESTGRPPENKQVLRFITNPSEIIGSDKQPRHT